MPRHRAGAAIFAALLLFTLSCDKGGSDLPLEPAYEEPQDASIAGEVTLGEVGLPGVEVSLSGPETRSVTTDAQGSFHFGELKRGSYSLLLWGFDPALHDFPITQQTVAAVDANEVKVQFVGSLVPQPPAAATGLQAQAGGSDRVALIWTDVSDNETAFEVERKDGEAGEWTKIGEAGADTTNYSDAGLTPNTTYGYRVRACNDVGCSPYTEEASATTEEVPPVAPGELVAEADGPFGVRLAWSDLSRNETGFEVERWTAVDSSWSRVGTSGADTASFTEGGLSPNTTYGYRVRACNEVGCSDYTDEASATTDDVPPEAPTELKAEAAGSSAIDLEWTDGSDNETGFEVERKEGAQGSWGQVGTAGADDTTVQDTGLSPTTTYTYRVRACNVAGCSDYTQEASATTDVLSGPNLFISDLYITQSTQTLGGDVPLVAGKAGYLRVFVLADEDNTFLPDVRVRFYLGGGLAHTETISAPRTSVPTAVYETSLGYTWNVAVPKSLIQTGLSILAEVDPGNGIPEGDETDNTFPASGSPLGMDVRSTPAFAVTFVPVRQSENDLAGYVTSGNASSFLDLTMRLLPIADSDATLHAEYLTSAPVLESDNGNSAWGTILSEIYALRVTEGGSGHYYGVVKTDYTSGVAGMGYLGWPAAVGWDRLPSASGVAAHEWGHNWDRAHAPGCGAGSPDPSFPYADGRIGVWGMNVGTEALKSPSTYYDFMSYCGPDWISDYNYEAILDYRQAQGAWAVSGSPEASLLVWGRMDGDRIVLEPAFRVTTIPVVPSGTGDYTVEGLGSEGSPLFSLAFQPMPVPDGTSGEGHFAFAIPLRSFDEARLAGLRVRGGGRVQGLLEARRGPGAVSPAEERVEVAPVAGSRVEMTWDARAFPMALVRDAGTGEVLSFARGGAAHLPIASGEVEVILSDGIRSSRPVRRVVR